MDLGYLILNYLSVYIPSRCYPVFTMDFCVYLALFIVLVPANSFSGRKIERKRKPVAALTS